MVASILVYAFVTGLIGNISSSADSSLVPVSGTLVVPSGSGAGSMVVTVRNSASNPIQSITVSVDSLDSGVTATNGANIYTAGQTPGFQLLSSNLPIGQSVSGIASLSGVTSGESYTFTVALQFFGQTGTTVYETLSVTAST